MVDPRVIRSRAAILSAATTLFLRDGYVATTMDGIAEAAAALARAADDGVRMFLAVYGGG